MTSSEKKMTMDELHKKTSPKEGGIFLASCRKNSKKLPGEKTISLMIELKIFQLFRKAGK